MNILHLSSKPVYPLVDGGCVAIAANLKALSELSDQIGHIYIETHKHPASRDLYPKNTRFGLEEKQSMVSTEISAIGALKGLLTGKNYNLSRFWSSEFADLLQQYLKVNKPDLIVLESLFLTPYLALIRSVSTARIVVRTHNVEHQLWEQQASEASFPKKWYLKKLAKSLKKEEIASLNNVDLIWTLTEEDASQLKKSGVTTPITYIPVAVRTAASLPDYTNPDFFHLGALNWEPNRLAVQRLIGDIWPKLPNAPVLHIAGSFPEELELTPSPVLQLHGFVKDAAAFMRDHGTLATPIVSGSGVRIKLLEAMAAGVPCISSTKGASGIRLHDSPVKIADSDAEWVAALSEFSLSETIRREYGEKGKAYMDNYHSFTAVKAQMLTSLGK